MKTDMYQLLRELHTWSKHFGTPILLLILAAEEDLDTKRLFVETLAGQ